MIDPHWYLRFAMAGWVLIAAFLGTAFSAGALKWSSLLTVIQNPSASLLSLAIGAILGIGAPPAVGFLLERIATMSLWGLGRNMWGSEFYPCDLGPATHRPAGAMFHIVFYSCADEKLLNWARRRRTQMFASLTSVLAIIIGCFAGIYVIHLKLAGPHWPLFLVWTISSAVLGLCFCWRQPFEPTLEDEPKPPKSVRAIPALIVLANIVVAYRSTHRFLFVLAMGVAWALAVVLFLHSLREEYIHRHTIRLWLDEFGAAALRHFTSRYQRTEVPVANQPSAAQGE